MSWSALDRVERAAVAVGAAGLLVAALVVAIGGAPVAWVLLAFCGALSAVVLFIQMKRGRFFEPLTVLAAVGLTSFAARPLDLFLSVDDLQSWHFESSDVERLLRIDNQETALFVTRELQEGLEPALTRAIASVAIFLGLALIGYLLPWGRSLASRLSRVGAGYTGRMDVPVVVGACLLIALVGQIAVLVKVGGLSGAANNMLHQKVLDTGLAYQTLLGFGTVGLLVWAAWSPPRTTRARVAFLAVTLEVCAYYAVAGTRTRVFLSLLAVAVVTHYIWRPWRLRWVVGGFLVVVVFAAGLLGIRQATREESISEAITSAPAYIADPRGILNDTTEFDNLFLATSVIGSEHEYHRPAPFRYGEGIVDAFYSYVPGRIAPDKPEGGDIEFRKIVWGNELKAGRPYTVIGDFWNDFGFPGVIVGSLLFGLLARALLGLVAAGATGAGREYRAVLYALGLVVFYMELTTTYAVALGFVITFGLPLLAAMYLIRPVSERLGRRLVGATRRPGGASA